MPWTNDPLADFDRHEAKQQKLLDKLPICVDCGEPITDDHFYMICDDPLCPSCLENNYRKDTDDYVG